jgi:hypothetical protein
MKIKTFSIVGDEWMNFDAVGIFCIIIIVDRNVRFLPLK